MIDRDKPVAGEHGVIVLILRQSWKLRNASDPALRKAMRKDVRNCVRLLRFNRELIAA